jgi:DNA polymerase-3 subunit gamma/tau
MLGTLDEQIIIDLLKALADQDGSALLQHSAHLNEQGANYARALSELLNLLHQIAIVQVVPEFENELLNEGIKQLSTRISREDTQLYYQIALIGQKDIHNAPTPRCGFEMTLLRMLAFAPIGADLSPTGAIKPLTSSNSRPSGQSSGSQEPVAGRRQSEAEPRQRQIQEKPGHYEPDTGKQATETAPKTPNSWHELFNRLNLTGAVRALAELCQLKSLNNDHLRLSLGPKHEPLLQQKHIKRIEEALQQLLNTPMKVSIDVEPSDSNATPAGRAEQERRNQKQQAEDALLADSAVQRLMHAFDATLIKESITPVEG